MSQSVCFEIEGKEHTVCRLKKISLQPQASLQTMVFEFGFKDNVVNQQIYLKIRGVSSLYVLYTDDSFLAINDFELLHETKQILSKTFEMKDVGEASFLLSIGSHGDMSHGLLELPQKLIMYLKGLTLMDVHLMMLLSLKKKIFSISVLKK